MSLLDRMRPQWQHHDAEVRAAAVRELGHEEQELLATVAQQDEDERVRRIAIKRLEDPQILLAVAASDPAEALRRLAGERAEDRLAVRAASDGDVAACRDALTRLTDGDLVARVVMTAAHPEVRAAGLARVSDVRTLGAIARGGEDATTRGAALARIDDLDALRRIAASDAPADVAVAAVDRIDQVDVLAALAAERAAHKRVRQQARERLETLLTDDHPIRVQQRREEQQGLCAAVEALADEADTDRAGALLRSAEHDWAALVARAAPDPTLAARFRAAADLVRERVVEVARRHVEEERRESERQGILAERARLCETVELLGEEGTPARLAAVRARWERLGPAIDPESEALVIRFAQACERCEERYRRWEVRADFRTRFEELASEAEELVFATDLRAAARAWAGLERRWAKVAAEPEAAKWLGGETALPTRFKEAGEKLAARAIGEQQEQEQQQQANLRRLAALCARLEPLIHADTVELKAAERGLASAAEALKHLPPLPPSESRSVWKARLETVCRELTRVCGEGERAEEWRRWANVNVQETLIDQAEALRQVEDLELLARELPRLQDEWRRFATAPRGKSQQLWDRFRTVRDELRARCDAYLAENVRKREALCEQAEQLAESTQWNQTAETIKRLQSEWKAIGAVPPKASKALWRRFQTPCNRFFERRKEHLDALRQEQSENAARKRALCQQAEAIAESTDWDAAVAEVKRLQAEWKQIGRVPAKKSEALWNRFRKACDHLFDRYRRRHEIEREGRVRGAEEAVTALEAIATAVAAPEAPDAETITQQVSAAVAAWGEVGALPRDRAAALDERLGRACEQILAVHPESLQGTGLDPSGNLKQREKLLARLARLADTRAQSGRPPAGGDLAAWLKESMAANTIGGAAGKRDEWRAAHEEAERVKAKWERLGVAVGEPARQLTRRFEDAYARLLAARPPEASSDRRRVKRR